ncbi:MAG: PilZ domain-containing protein [Myxococcales bacterium]|nr:PilZ domain-containing protein [Myxococcales bacterium]
MEQRRQPRIPFSCSARLVADGRNVPIAAQVQNLSAGGLFLTADVAPALGTAVRCRFRIGQTPRELRGRIAWVERRPSGDPRGPGAGIEFLDLRESERLLLEDVTSGAPKEDESPLQALSVWFEGLTAPVRTQGHVSADEIVVTTQLPFLRIGSDVKVGFSPEEDGPHRYARIDGLSLDFLRPHEPPRIVVTLRTANELQGEAGELSHALRSRREAFAGSESAPHPPEAPRPVPRGAEPPSAPRAAEPPSAPRAAEPPSAPRAAEPPSAPRAAEPPSAPRAAEPPSAPRAGARRVFTSAGALTPPPQLLGSMAPELQRPGATPALLGASPLATLAAAPVPRTPVPAPAAPVPLGPIAAARSGPSAAPGPVRAGALPWRKTFMLAAVALCVGASAVFLFRGSRHEPSRVAAPSPAAPARPQVSPLGAGASAIGPREPPPRGPGQSRCTGGRGCPVAQGRRGGRAGRESQAGRRSAPAAALREGSVSLRAHGGCHHGGRPDLGPERAGGGAPPRTPAGRGGHSVQGETAARLGELRRSSPHHRSRGRGRAPAGALRPGALRTPRRGLRGQGPRGRASHQRPGQMRPGSSARLRRPPSRAWPAQSFSLGICRTGTPRSRR